MHPDGGSPDVRCIGQIGPGKRLEMGMGWDGGQRRFVALLACRLHVFAAHRGIHPFQFVLVRCGGKHFPSCLCTMQIQEGKKGRRSKSVVPIQLSGDLFLQRTCCKTTLTQGTIPDYYYVECITVLCYTLATVYTAFEVPLGCFVQFGINYIQIKC